MKLIVSVLSLLIIYSNAAANASEVEKVEHILNPDHEPFFNFNFGVEPFLGLIGFEYQSGHNSIGIGLPGHLSYRYYFNPYRDTKFVGAYIGKYKAENANDTVDGVFYKEKESEFFGVGYGKRWQWPSGWNFTLTIAIEYSDNKYSNPGSSIKGKDKSIFLFPGVSGGYKF